jgi:hypothetical protein
MKNIPIIGESEVIYKPPTGKVSGTIGIVCSDQARYSHFTSRLVALAQCYPSVKFHMNIGNQLTHARNKVMEKAEGEWLWFMDDDHTFQPQVLQNLLDRNLPIVGPLYVQRRMPPQPVARIKMEDGQWVAPNLWLVPPGIYEVNGTGTAGMLIRRRVWEAIAAKPELMPWFRVGTVQPDLISEDLAFCESAEKCGYSTFIDTTQILGHCSNTILLPQWVNDKWVMELQFPHGSIQIPCYNAPPVEDDELPEDAQET